MPTGDNCSPWRTVAPIACNVSGTKCRPFSTPSKMLTKSTVSAANHVGLWVRLSVGLQQTSEQLTYCPFFPLGYLIKLKDPELALSIEVCLKALLLAFTCDNYEDEKVLKDLMAKVFQHGRRPTIITSRFFSRVHDTRKR